MPTLPPVRSIVFSAHGEKAERALLQAEALLRSWDIPSFRDPEACTQLPDLMVSLGGDGTLLRASAWAAEHGVPVLGINHGTLGFLTAYTAEEMRAGLHDAILGDLFWENRSRMKTELVRGGHVVGSWCSLNDTIIKYGKVPRLITLRATVDGQYMATYRADGLIICTPTGSTAYNLAAGGPVIFPRTKAFAITPLCPHSVTHRPVIVDSDNTIEIEFMGPEDRDATLTVDGKFLGPLVMNDVLRITGDCKPLRLCPSTHGSFEIMHEKMGWDGNK